MTRTLILIALLGLIAGAAPAHAARIPFCDDIKDDQARMACLQQHISYLEETILRLQGDVAGLTETLDKMANTSSVYKLQSVSVGKCLGIGGQQQQSAVMISCDRPDSWKLILGGQTPPKKEKPAAEADATSGATGPAGNTAAPNADKAVAPTDADKPKKKKKKQADQQSAPAAATAPAAQGVGNAVKKSGGAPAASGQ